MIFLSFFFSSFFSPLRVKNRYFYRVPRSVSAQYTAGARCTHLCGDFLSQAARGANRWHGKRRRGTLTYRSILCRCTSQFRWRCTCLCPNRSRCRSCMWAMREYGCGTHGQGAGCKVSQQMIRCASGLKNRYCAHSCHRQFLRHYAASVTDPSSALHQMCSAVAGDLTALCVRRAAASCCTLYRRDDLRPQLERRCRE